jgi:hypothetical protein
MELLNVKKTSPGNGEFEVLIADTLLKYDFTYENPGIIVAHFPDEFVSLLRQLPVKVAQSMVNRIIKTLENGSTFSSYKVELEKEILAVV